MWSRISSCFRPPKRDPQIESDRCQGGIKTAVLESVFVASVQKAVFVRFIQCSGVCVRPVDFLSWC